MKALWIGLSALVFVSSQANAFLCRGSSNGFKSTVASDNSEYDSLEGCLCSLKRNGYFIDPDSKQFEIAEQACNPKASKQQSSSSPSNSTAQPTAKPQGGRAAQSSGVEVNKKADCIQDTVRETDPCYTTPGRSIFVKITNQCTCPIEGSVQRTDQNFSQFGWQRLEPGKSTEAASLCAGQVRSNTKSMLNAYRDLAPHARQSLKGSGRGLKWRTVELHNLRSPRPFD